VFGIVIGRGFLDDVGWKRVGGGGGIDGFCLV